MVCRNPQIPVYGTETFLGCFEVLNVFASQSPNPGLRD